MRTYLLHLLILVPIVVFLRVDFFFTVVYLLGATYLLSRVWTRRAAVGLQAKRRFQERAFLGDQVEVELTVENTGRLPVPWLEVTESTPLELTRTPFGSCAISLGARETWSTTYTLDCRRRGYYHVGPLELHSGDLLGIQPRAQARVGAGRITVCPRVVPIEQLGIPTHSPLVALPARSPLFEDPSRSMGVRDYERGDSPRRIHWPATARTGHLVVKQYQPAIARETLICLDLDLNDYDRERQFLAPELAIVAAASIASHIILQERLPAGLATEAIDPLAGGRSWISIPPRAERTHLTVGLLELLGRVQVLTGAHFGEQLRSESVKLAWGATIVVITGRADEELLRTLLGLRRRGFAISLLLVQPSQPSAGVQAQAGIAGVSVHQVWSERDLETWR